MTVLEKLRKFIDEGKDAGYVPPMWLDDDDMKVYVRKGRHILQGGKIRVTLDIANVTVEEDKRGKGIFSKFLEQAHEMNPWDATYVECVHNQDLAVFLLKSGWMMVDPSLTVGANSFFLMKNWDDFFPIPGLTKKSFDLQ
jgi:hypothetical protein